MLREVEIDCPSGLRGIATEMTVRDAQILANATHKGRAAALNRLLGSRWKETIDPGPYALDPRGQINWAKTLNGDRMHAIIRIRATTWGEDHRFRVKCDNDICGITFTHTVRLDQLRIQKLSDDAKERFANGNRFEGKLEGTEIKVVFCLPTGELVERTQNLISRNRENALLLTLRTRILEMYEGDNAISANDINARLTRMSLRDMYRLLNLFDEHDCGVDTDIDIECPECSNDMEATLPFDSGFFSPRRRERRRPTI